MRTRNKTSQMDARARRLRAGGAVGPDLQHDRPRERGQTTSAHRRSTSRTPSIARMASCRKT